MNRRAAVSGIVLFTLGVALAGAALAVDQPGAGSPPVVARKVLTLAGARAAVEAAMSKAAKENAHPSIAVVDEGGYLLAFARTETSFAAGAEVSIGKARTSALFKKPTRVFEESINKGRYAMLDATTQPTFTPLQGGVPIEIDGEIVGAIGVSGAASAQQDEEIAIAGAGFATTTASSVGAGTQ